MRPPLIPRRLDPPGEELPDGAGGQGRLRQEADRRTRHDQVDEVLLGMGRDQDDRDVVRPDRRDPADHVEIWFDVDVESGIPDNGYPYDGDVGGTPYTHPEYDESAFYLHDLGLVVLDEPVHMDEYGVLPELNELDALSPGRHTVFTAVGYGLQRSFPDAASWKNEADRVRMISRPPRNGSGTAPL